MDGKPFKDMFRDRQRLSGNINPYVNDPSWNRDVVRDNMIEVIRFFKEALEKDPFFKDFTLEITGVELPENKGEEIGLGTEGIASIALVLKGSENLARDHFRYEFDISGKVKYGRAKRDDMVNDFTKWKSTFPH
ncbi:hypothetical protein [Flavobacterium sp.]|uniref:hypothetical protein n=1 Tax=Flavobacterium sp. TaxID=239 RepID=UPI003266E870